MIFSYTQRRFNELCFILR